MMSLLNKKYIVSGLVVLSLLIAWSSVFDVMAKEFTNEGLVQSGAFFGTIRFLNAVISVFQEVEINFFVSSLAVGELLDPVNDLVEYVSEGLKLAIGSYLLQRVIVEVSSTFLFNIIFTISGLGYIASLYFFSLGLKAVLYKTFLTMLFLRFAVILAMFATTAFSASFLDQKIESENQKTATLSSELNDTRAAAEGVSEELMETIRLDIEQLEAEKKEVLDQIRPLEQRIRENQYTISNKESEVDTIKDDLPMIESMRGNDELDALNDEIDELESQNEEMSDQVDDLNDRVEFLESEIERAESHLYEESDGFIKTLAGGVGSAWETVSKLAKGLVDSTMSALVLFLFKMLILPIGFLYVLFKLFKKLWGMDISEAGRAAKEEVVETIDKNTNRVS